MTSRPARQERLLERQRGAGTRQVKNLDIGLILPGQENPLLQSRRSGRRGPTPQQETLPPQKSSRRTPAPELLPQRSSRRTPAAESALPKSIRRTPAPPVLPPQRSSRPYPTEASRKRARSASEDIVHNDRDYETRNATEKKRKLSRKPVIIEEEPTRSAVTENDRQAEDPTQDATFTKSAKKRKKRKSIGQQSSKRAKVKVPPETQRHVSKANSGRGRPRKADTAPSVEEMDHIVHDVVQEQLRTDDAELAIQPQPTEPEPVILSSVEPMSGHTPRKAKKRKRVSIGQQSRRKAKLAMMTVKEEPAEDEAPSLNQEVGEPARLTEEDEEVELEAQITHALADAEQAKPKRKKRKSIGQQKPKRTSIYRNTVIPESKAPSRRGQSAGKLPAREDPIRQSKEQGLPHLENDQPEPAREAHKTKGRKKTPSRRGLAANRAPAKQSLEKEPSNRDLPPDKIH
ncbi:MAG: hypothetical protein Q9164_004840, partial [Protoblastenia rupestris]